MDQPTHLLNVLTPDRTGIIARMTHILHEQQVDIMEMSQTVLCGYFTVLVAAKLDEHADAEQLVDALRQELGEPKCYVQMIDYRNPDEVLDEATQYILTATGEYRRDLIQRMADMIAQRGGNILDLSTKQSGNRMTLVAEVHMPCEADLNELQNDLTAVGAEAGLSVRFQHHRLFTATQEISFRRLG